MKKSKLNWLFTGFLAMILAGTWMGCEKDSAYLFLDEMNISPNEQEVTDCLDPATGVETLTPEGYIMIPFSVALEVKAESFYEADAVNPFSVTLTGEGLDETLGAIRYFERIDLRPLKGQAIMGRGRIERDASAEARCIPNPETLFFTTSPTTVWDPMPVGNYNVAASVLIKGGYGGFDGAYGEAYRTITFVEGQFNKGIGLLEGFVFVPEAP